MNRAHWKVPRYARQSDPLYTEGPYDKWHAWQDIIARCNALEKPYVFMAGSRKISLARGQCLVCSQNLGDDWGWSKTIAARFLVFLDTDGRISRRKMGRVGTLVTVKNFAKWQGGEFLTTSEPLTQSRHAKRHENGHSQAAAPSMVSGTPDTVGDTVDSQNATQSRHDIKKYKKSTTAASAHSHVDNCGQLSPTEMAARIYEVARLASGDPTRPPSKRETQSIKRTVAANNGDWEPIREVVRDSIAKAIARGDTVRSPIMYGLGTWKKMQEAKRKTEQSKPVPVLSGLVGSIAGASTSPAQRRSRKQHTGADPEGKPGDGVTRAEQDAVKRVRRDMGLEE